MEHLIDGSSGWSPDFFESRFDNHGFVETKSHLIHQNGQAYPKCKRHGFVYGKLPNGKGFTTCQLCRKLYARKMNGHTEEVELEKRQGLFDFWHYGEGADGVLKAIQDSTQLERDLIQHSRNSGGIEMLPHKATHKPPRHMDIEYLSRRFDSPTLAARFLTIVRHFTLTVKDTYRLIDQIQKNPQMLIELEMLRENTTDPEPEPLPNTTPLYMAEEGEEAEQDTPRGGTDEYNYHPAEPETPRTWYARQGRLFKIRLHHICRTSTLDDLVRLSRYDSAEHKAFFARLNKTQTDVIWTHIKRRRARLEANPSPLCRQFIRRIKASKEKTALIGFKIAEYKRKHPDAMQSSEWKLVYNAYMNRKASEIRQ